MADYTGYGDLPNDDLSLRQAWANILRGLSDKQSWQDLGQGIQNTAQLIPNVAESVTRGNIAGTIGAFGDLRDLKNSINSYLPQSVQNFQAAAETLSNPIAKALVQRSPTAENVYDVMPRITDEYEGYKQHEKIGEFIGPAAGGVIYDVAKLGKNLPVGASIKAVDELPTPKVETFKPEKNELGFYSTLEDTVGNLKQEKGTGQQFLAQITKAPAVKPEEVALRGLDEFLANNPKVTRKEIMDYLANNKVKLEETVLDEGHYKQGTYEDYNIGEGREFDDVDYINGRAEDIHMEMKEDLASREEIMNDLLAKNPEKYDDWENNPTLAEKLERDIDDTMYDLAHEEATAEYWSDPIYEYRDEFGFEVIGNDNLGYSLKDSNGKWLNQSFNDISDAEAFLRDHHLENGDLRYESNGPKYADYQLPNGENYREVLIQYPDTKGGDFSSGHFDEPNILAHMRVNDRVIDGKKTLFIEEIQSDWHQAGRKKGYESENKIKREEELKKIEDEREVLLAEKLRLEQEAEPFTSQGKDAPPEIVDRWSAVSNRITNLQSAENRLYRARPEGVPDAPYKKNWQELAMKRAMQMAAEGGYDRIAFTTGAQQADRYNLAKQVNSIDWNPYESRGANKLVTIVPKNGNRIELPLDKDGNVIKEIGGQFAGKPIDDIVGKDIAKKIMDSQNGDLSGQGLSIGGEGMKGFYDKILPDFVNKYGKKYGMKVGKTNLKAGRDTANFNEFVDWAQTQDSAKLFNRKDYMDMWESYKNGTNVVLVDRYMKSGADATQEVHYFDLTPEAKSSFLEKGSPLFAAPAIGLTGEESRREILEKLMK